jgi:hypothetical protein
MSVKRFLIAILVAGMTLAAQAAAQTKNELSGEIGRVFVSDHGVQGVSTFDPILHTGNGLSFEVNYGRHFLDKGIFGLTLEVPLVVTPNEETHFSVNLVPEGYTSFFITPSARLNFFAQNAVSPWVSFGGGYAHFGASTTLEFGGPNPGSTSTNTGVLQMGVGLDVKVNHAFSVRGEARDFYAGIPQLNVDINKGHQHNIFVGGGVVWHF